MFKNIYKKQWYMIIFILYFLLLSSGCGGRVTLSKSSESPTLHDKYNIVVDERSYAVLPLPDEFHKDDWVEFHILEYPKKGTISMVDRYRGFFNYFPREGVYGYDFFVYNVSDGVKVVKKIIQLNIKERK